MCKKPVGLGAKRTRTPNLIETFGVVPRVIQRSLAIKPFIAELR